MSCKIFFSVNLCLACCICQVTSNNWSSKNKVSRPGLNSLSPVQQCFFFFGGGGGGGSLIVQDGHLESREFCSLWEE